MVHAWCCNNYMYYAHTCFCTVCHCHPCMHHVSGINMAQCCAIGIDHYGTIIWLNAVHQASLWRNMAQCCVGINLCPNAVHHVYSSNLWLHHVSIWLNVVAATTQAVHHASIWLNMAQYSIIHHTKLAISYFVHFLFWTLFAVNTWRKERKEKKTWTKSCFACLPVCYLGDAFRQCRYSCWPGQCSKRQIGTLKC